MRVISIHLDRLASALGRHGSGWDFGHAPAGARSLAQFCSAGCYTLPFTSGLDFSKLERAVQAGRGNAAGLQFV
jgi:hypothetical protein